MAEIMADAIPNLLVVDDVVAQKIISVFGGEWFFIRKCN